MNKERKFKLCEISFHNRWNMKYPNKNWTIVGVSRWWAGCEIKRFGIDFFGLDVFIWFERLKNK